MKYEIGWVNGNRSMGDSTDKVIQFLVGAQNDFIGRIGSDETPPNNLHVGHEASVKLRGQGGSPDPFC